MSAVGPGASSVLRYTLAIPSAALGRAPASGLGPCLYHAGTVPHAPNLGSAAGRGARPDLGLSFRLWPEPWLGP